MLSLQLDRISKSDEKLEPNAALIGQKFFEAFGLVLGLSIL